MRHALAVSQVGLATILAVGAGVMIRTVDNLYNEDMGFSGEGVLTFRVDLPGGSYGDAAARARLRRGGADHGHGGQRLRICAVSRWNDAPGDRGRVQHRDLRARVSRHRDEQVL